MTFLTKVALINNIKIILLDSFKKYKVSFHPKILTYDVILSENGTFLVAK